MSSFLGRRVVSWGFGGGCVASPVLRPPWPAVLVKPLCGRRGLAERVRAQAQTQAQTHEPRAGLGVVGHGRGSGYG